MNLLQIIALMALISGLGMWVASRKRGSSPALPVAAVASLIGGLIAGLIGAWITPSSSEDELYQRVARAQWQYPLQRVAEKVGHGKIVILTPADDPSLNRDELPMLIPEGSSIEIQTVPETGLSAAILKKYLAQKPAAIILNARVPQESEPRDEFFSELGTGATAVPMLYTAGVTRDTADLFSRGLIWASIETQNQVDVSRLPSHASVEECFEAARRFCLAPAASPTSSTEAPTGDL